MICRFEYSKNIFFDDSIYRVGYTQRVGKAKLHAICVKFLGSYVQINISEIKKGGGSG